MTEEEARTKWCPQVRFVIDSETVFPTGNRFEGEDGSSPTAREAARHCRCIASACMAWRRQVVLIDRATNEPATLGVAALGQLEERWGAGGYCGLAGSPS